MVGSRSPAIIRTGSINSDPWWGTKEAIEIRRTTEQLRILRNFAAAGPADQRGLGLVRQRNDDRAGDFFTRAIEEARVEGDVALEARAWDLLGEERQSTRDLGAAGADFTEAFRLRVLADRADLAFSYARLGLKLAESDCLPDEPKDAQNYCQNDQKRRRLREADRFTTLALSADALGAPGLPIYLLLHQRGQIRLARGDTRGALADFAAALDKAESSVLPAHLSLIVANRELEHRIFRSFIETAASEGLRTGNARLVSESFQARELNRAALLSESSAFAGVRCKTLCLDYARVA
jgi:hypothetical protein